MTPASSTLVRETRPAAGGVKGRQAAPRRERTAPPVAPRVRASARPAGRMRLLPFALLVLVLLAAGLVAMLLLNTALAQGAFRLAALQKTSATLSDQQQQLQALLAHEQSSAVLAAKAKSLHMQDTCSPHFLVLSTGRTYGDACTASPAPAQPAPSAPAAAATGAPAVKATASAASSPGSTSSAGPAPTSTLAARR